MTPGAPKILWITPDRITGVDGWAIQTAEDCWEAVDQLRNSSFDVVVVEARPDQSVDELIEELARVESGVLILVRDAAGRVSDAVRYMRLGAHDVADAGSDMAAMIQVAVEFNRSRRPAKPAEEPWRKLLVGSSRSMLRTADIIRLVGGRRSTVLITGETGTGKEVIARAIHMSSGRASLPMVTVNCNALPEHLLEAELFGHVKGAFTGAVQDRVGRFEQAHRGTMFLDEIGDLPLEVQTKLLRVLQEREFQRVGSSETVRVDVRLIAATHVNLAERIREGRFREDLYYRINVVPISTPPLRERLEDIPQLVHHFVEKICRLEGIPARRLTPETLARLKEHSWPGNVRQLENTVERAIAMSGERETLLAADFVLSGGVAPRPISPARAAIAVPDAGLDFDLTVSGIERQILEQALLKAGGNKTAAAGMLGLKRTTLAAKLKSLEAAAG